MGEDSIIGVDLENNVFQLHGAASDGSAGNRRHSESKGPN